MASLVLLAQAASAAGQTPAAPAAPDSPWSWPQGAVATGDAADRSAPTVQDATPGMLPEVEPAPTAPPATPPATPTDDAAPGALPTSTSTPTPEPTAAAPAPAQPQPPQPPRPQQPPQPDDDAAPPLAADAGTRRTTGILFRVLPPVVASEDAAMTATPAPAPAYLFGTVHFGTDAELGLDAARLDTLLGPVSRLVGEVDVDAVVDASLDPYRWLPESQPLSTLIDADARAMARYLLPAVAPATLERMKPWMVLALLEARGESLGDATLDVRLQRAARARSLPVVQLESLEDQLRALDCVPSESQAVVLQERLKTPWVLREMSGRALAHYRARDLDAWLADVERMPGLGDEARAIEQQARRCLIEDRNARWMPALLALLASGDCLVAVGAIHLPGEHGLLASLARAGYRIEAVPL